jgi:hypothetical protein
MTSFLFTIYLLTIYNLFEGAKVRISEQKAKGKLVFLLFFKREYLRRGQKSKATSQKALDLRQQKSGTLKGCRFFV